MKRLTLLLLTMLSVLQAASAHVWVGGRLYVYASHSSIVEYKGQGYLFYHGCQFTQRGNLRSICVDRLFHNPEGAFRKNYKSHHNYLPRK